MAHTIHFEWELPEPLLDMVLKDEGSLAEECKRAAVLDWVRMQRISWRKGAELLGTSYRDFLLLLSEHKIPLADYSEGWLGKELDTLQHSPSTSLP
jgi:predicted HTH domain antitoxin